MNPMSWNRYAYCLNNPYKYVDPDETFSEGIQEEGRFLSYDEINSKGITSGLGHMNFPNIAKDGTVFDFYTLDREIFSHPRFLTGNRLHFFNHSEGLREMLTYEAASHNKQFFEYYMHMWQDYYVHYANGYRWYTYGLGHARDSIFFILGLGANPDDDYDAWTIAAKETTKFINIWNKSSEDRKSLAEQNNYLKEFDKKIGSILNK